MNSVVIFLKRFDGVFYSCKREFSSKVKVTTEINNAMSRKFRGKAKYDFGSRQNYQYRSESSTSQDHQAQESHWDEGKSSRGNRHPPGLRGKQIGLFYRDQSRQKKRQAASQKSLDLLTIEPNVSREIQRLISLSPNATSQLDSTSGEGPEEYSHIGDSQFKQKFLRIISGNIQKNLENAMTMAVKLKRDPDLDEKLRCELQRSEGSREWREMLEFREKLPAFERREEIVKMVEENQVVLISGETGCGKTTQVAQFILDHEIKWGNGSVTNIACTQPRRISAISVAERVAAERGENLGKSVGFHIRLEKVLPNPQSSILFCTTAMLLQFMQSDPALRTFSHIILDEIHERSTQSDFIIALLKQVIPKRPDLKVVLMSATLNAEQFSKYYNNCPTIHIPGFTYPVEEYFLEDALALTRFQFPPQAETPKDGRRYTQKYKEAASKKDEFSNYVEPYVRHLRSMRKYPEYVLQELKNPNSEKLCLEFVEALLHKICLNQGPGAVLIFLPGLVDISKLHKLLLENGRYPQDRFVIYPLHSRMPTMDQKMIFQRPPDNVRKIIIATSIAETSITVEDVVYVIDCGKTKRTNFDIENNLETLDQEWVTIANAKQRKGRAGRVRPGICYHLFSKARQATLPQYPVPEMMCTRLDGVILSLKILQLGKAEGFLASVMDPPNPKAIELSLELLRTLNALDDNETLTPLGYHLAQLPLDPRTGKMIIWASLFSCLNPVLAIAASLSFKDAFYAPLGMEKEADARKLELGLGQCSDHVALAQAVERYEDAKNQSWSSLNNFCFRYFLSKNTLKLLVDMKKQFACYLHEMKFLPDNNVSDQAANKNSSNLELVKAIVCAGLFPNVATIVKVNKQGATVRTEQDGAVKIHPSSVNEKQKEFPYPYLTYYMKQKSTAIYLFDTTCVSPYALLLASPNSWSMTGMGSVYQTIVVTKDIKFNCHPETAKIIRALQKKLNEILEYKINHPGATRNKIAEENVLRAVVALISQSQKKKYTAHQFDSQY